MVNVIVKMFSDPMVTLIKIIRNGIGRTGKPVLSLDDEQEALYRWCSSVGLSRVDYLSIYLFGKPVLSVFDL